MWLDLAIALSCGGGGLVCGWVIHAIGGIGNHALVKQAAARINDGEVQGNSEDDRIIEVADRLKSYALSMAADVDAHQTKVQAVNNSLIESGESSPKSVVKAVNLLIAANEAMQTQLQQAQEQIHEQAEQIESAEHRATTDALTRVPNRGAFDKHLEHRHSLGPGKAGTLALLDVDHFKKFNDFYGHRAGDEVLRVVAKILYARLQGYGLVARYGGEEFVVILDGYSVDQAKDLIEAARVAIGEREIIFEDKRLRVSASAGVAELVEIESTDQWLQRADDAMYQSKEAGRNCAHWMDGTVPIRIERVKPIGVAAGSGRTQPVAKLAAENTAAPQLGQAAKANESPAQQASSTLAARDTARDDAPDLDLDVPSPPTEERSKADPSAFAYLPDRETLGVSFDEFRGRTQSTVSMFVMAIRCNKSASKASMRSLLQIVRATLRSVDRIGCNDDSTLLVCMPSIDGATAFERGKQICRSAQAIGLGKTGNQEQQIAIGIAEPGTNEEFSAAVSRAIRLSGQEPDDGTDPVCIEAQRALA